MNPADQHRIAPRHLERSANVYVRQSDPQQVREHTESTRLQRGLREKAISLGWSNPTLVEDDQGITASGFADRPGFQWLLTQVTLRKKRWRRATFVIKSKRGNGLRSNSLSP